MEILIQSIRIIEREENKISKRELPEEFNIETYLDLPTAKTQ